MQNRVESSTSSTDLERVPKCARPEFAAERARAFLSMASEPEGPAADTIISDGNRRATPDEVTQADEQWPVSDLYYVDSEKAAAADTVDDDSANATVVTTSGVGSVRRRLPPESVSGECSRHWVSSPRSSSAACYSV